MSWARRQGQMGLCGAKGTVRVRVRDGQRPWIQGMTGRRWRSLEPIGCVDGGQLYGFCSKNEQKSPEDFKKGKWALRHIFKEKQRVTLGSYRDSGDQ